MWETHITFLRNREKQSSLCFLLLGDIKPSKYYASVGSTILGWTKKGCLESSCILLQEKSLSLCFLLLGITKPSKYYASVGSTILGWTKKGCLESSCPLLQEKSLSLCFLLLGIIKPSKYNASVFLICLAQNMIETFFLTFNSRREMHIIFLRNRKSWCTWS